MIVVSDTSPITSLLSIDLIEILEKMYQRVIIPDAVYKELVEEHITLPVFIEIEHARDKNYIDALKKELDEGEAEAIVLAKEKDADILLIDEKKGRRIAEREGIAIIGLIGVLLAAEKKGFIKSVIEVISLLHTKAGFHISESLRDHIKKISRK